MSISIAVPAPAHLAVRPFTETPPLNESAPLPRKSMQPELMGLSASEVAAWLNNAATLSETRAPIGLAPPLSASKALSPEIKAALTHILTQQQQGYDVEKMDRTVAGVASLYGAQWMSGLAVSNGDEKGKSGVVASGNDRVSAPQARRASPAIAGGTDITAPAASGGGFSNVLGNVSMLHAFISIMKALNQQEARANMHAAQWSQNIMASAQATGKHLINAAEERKTGALAGGLTGLGMQFVATGLMFKSVNQQVKSIKGNLKQANKTDRELRSVKNEIKLKQEKEPKPVKPKGPDNHKRVAKQHTDMIKESEVLRNDHGLAAHSGSKTRFISESLTQTTRVTHDVIDRTYDVSASTSSKEAEMTRANQTVSSEVDNAHLQVGRKSAEGESALRQSLLSVLSNSNDAISAVASRMG